MRGRGQVGWAVLVLLLVVGGGLFVERRVGPKAVASGPSPSAASGAWFCPHGGGDGWRATLEVANPGPSPVSIRVTGLSANRASPPLEMSVQPGTEVLVPRSANAPESSSFIEYFGGWVAAGWVTHGGGGQIGTAAEPCLPRAGRQWFLPDGDTTEHRDAYVVVMNPFSTEAVFTITLYEHRRAPITAGPWTNVPLEPHRSEAFRLNAKALGESVVSALVDVKVGRVAASSLDVSSLGGIRSSVGILGPPPPRSILPGGLDQGSSELLVMNPGQARPSFDGVLLSPDGSQPIPSLAENAPAPASAQLYPITTQGASTIVVRSAPGVAVALRTTGRVSDQASTTGAAAPAAAWVILPATAGTPAHPSIVLANPGDRPASVTLTLLPSAREATPLETTVEVPPGRTVLAPADFASARALSAVLARATTGTFVAASASYSLGTQGFGSYAVALGVPIPSGAA